MPREREETPEMVSIHFRRDVLRRARRSVLGSALAVILGGGSIGGVFWLHEEQTDIKADAVESKQTATVADRRAKAVDQVTDKVYSVGATKDTEQDRRLNVVTDRFNELRAFCMATRSSGNGRHKSPPAELVKAKPIPIPPTADAAAIAPKPIPPEPLAPDAGTEEAQ